MGMRGDQDDEIAEALDRLHAGGWAICVNVFHAEGGRISHVVFGWNGENRILAAARTCGEALRRALGQAAEVGMLPGWPRPSAR